eukprot:s374_g48.t1
MKIQLLSLVSAAVALSLPEILALPDLVEIVENSFHGNFTAQTVEEPKALLPTIAEIRAMTDQERADRFHWFLSVFLLVFLCVVISGTVIMVVGAELKALGSYRALDRTAPLSQGAQVGLVMLSFGGTVLLSFAACLWSLENGRLSKTFGLDWEIYLLLFCCAGASLLIQAVLAVAWLKAGDRFDATAFAMASFSSMAPFISDQFDTLKDVIFGGLCLQSQHVFMKVHGEWSGGCWEGTILPTIYRQVTRSKRHHLLIENIPQALMSVLFLAIEGGSFFVAALNLIVPGVQIALTFLLFMPVRAAAIPALGKRLSRAMKSGNILAAKALWEEAEIGYDTQLFALMLPHLTFFLDVTKSCGFMSEELQDLDKLSDQELQTLQGMAAVFAGQAFCYLWDRKIGHSGAKVVAEALKNSATQWLDLGNSEIGDQGVEALAEGLKSNGSLQWLHLGFNNISDRGAQALAESLKSNGSLGLLDYLNLVSNNIGDRGAEALAESLKSNGSLEELLLGFNNIGDRGAEALAEGLKSNGSLGRLELHHNNIGDRGAEALAAGLLQNRSLQCLYLSKFGTPGREDLKNVFRDQHLAWPRRSRGSLARGGQALEEAEKIKKERGESFEIRWH